MNKETHILPLSESMELTMDKANLSVIAGLGEVAIDAIIEDGVLRDIPIIGQELKKTYEYLLDKFKKNSNK